MLYIGEEVGLGEGPEVDVALDPLEGTTICAKNLPNSLAVIALAEKGALLNAPDVYMEKLAVGPGYPEGVVDIEASPAENLHNLASAKGVPVSHIAACILDRPRHARLIEEVRATGAAIRLIGDGDVAGVIDTTDPDETGIDIYLGTGGAPEGVLAAAAMRCIGGQMQGRLILDTEEKRERAARMGISDPAKIYGVEEMAHGDVLFAATGVTDGNLMAGVRFGRYFDPHRNVGAALVFAHRARDQGAASGPGEILNGSFASRRPTRLSSHYGIDGRLMSERRYFLGVRRSANGCAWEHRLDQRQENIALQIAQGHGLPDLVARVLAGRGVAAEAAARFLEPTIRDLLPDPATLTDMDKAAGRIADAVAAARACRHLRRLRCRRRLLVRHARAVSRAFRHRGRNLHSRPHLRGLRAQSRCDARIGGARRAR